MESNASSTNANNSSDSNVSTPRDAISRYYHRPRHHDDIWSGDDEWQSREERYNVISSSIPPEISEHAGQLRQYLTKLQSTIDTILSTNEVLNNVESPVEDLTNQLHDEYERMSGTLNRLESMLLGQNVSSSEATDNRSANNVCMPTMSGRDELGLLDCVVSDRDEVIRRLSERIRVLCHANEQLYVDFESQEHMLMTEMRHLREQLEKANHAIQLLGYDDYGHRAEAAVHGSVSVMHEAQEQINSLRTELMHKEEQIHELEIRVVETASKHNIELKGLQRLFEFYLGDLEFAGMLHLEHLTGTEDIRNVLERLRGECLQMMAKLKESQATIEGLHHDSSLNSTSLAHFLHRFLDQARSLMQKLRLHSLDTRSDRLAASWETLKKVELRSANVNDVYDVTNHFVQELFDYLHSEIQTFEQVNKDMSCQMETILRDSTNLKARTAQLEAWNKDNEERIQQMEHDRDEEIEISQLERADSLSKCQTLADQVNRLKHDLDAERLEKTKILRDGQGLREQCERYLRRAGDFESRYLQSQEEATHLAIKVKELESSCEHFQSEIARLHNLEGSMSARIESQEQANLESTQVYHQVCNQMITLQAEKNALEQRLAQVSVFEEQMHLKEATEAALQEELARLRMQVDGHDRSTALLAHQQAELQVRESALISTIQHLQMDLQSFKDQTDAQQTRTDMEVDPTSISKDPSSSKKDETDGSKRFTSNTLKITKDRHEVDAAPSDNTQMISVEDSNVDENCDSIPIVIECVESRPSKGSLTSGNIVSSVQFSSIQGPVDSRTEQRVSASKSEVYVDMAGLTSPEKEHRSIQSCEKHLSALLLLCHPNLSSTVNDELQHVIHAVKIDDELPVILKASIQELGEAIVSKLTAVTPSKIQISECLSDAELNKSESLHRLMEGGESTGTVSQRYEKRRCVMESELKSHSHQQFASIKELQESLRVQDALVKNLTNVILDFTEAIHDDVPLYELRELFACHANLPNRVIVELNGLRDKEEHNLAALLACEQELFDRYQQIMVQDFIDNQRSDSPLKVNNLLIQRLQELKTQLENPDLALNPDIIKLLNECLQIYSASAMATSHISDPDVQLPLSMTSQSVDVAGLTSTVPIASVSKSISPKPENSTKQIHLIFELFELEKCLRGRPLEEKIIALQDLAAEYRKTLTDETDAAEREDLEVIVSLVEGLAKVVQCEKKTEESEASTDGAGSDTLNVKGKQEVGGLLKATVLKISALCTKTIADRQVGLTDLLQKHVDKMRNATPHEMIVLTAVAEILKTLIHISDTETKMEELQKETDDLKSRLVADEAVLGALTHFEIPSDLVSSDSSTESTSIATGETFVSEGGTEKKMHKSRYDIPSTLPLCISGTLKNLRAIATQPQDSRMNAIKALLKENKARLKTAQGKSQDDFMTAGAIIEIAQILGTHRIDDALIKAESYEKISKFVDNLVDTVSQIDTSRDESLKTMIANYETKLSRVSSTTERAEIELAIQVLKAVEKMPACIAKTRGEILSKAISNFEELNKLPTPERKARLEQFSREISDKESAYKDLDEASAEIIKGLIKVVEDSIIGAEEIARGASQKTAAKVDVDKSEGLSWPPEVAAKGLPNDSTSITQMSLISSRGRASSIRTSARLSHVNFDRQRTSQKKINELDTILGRLPAVLCDEVLGYLELRLPPTERDLLKTLEEIREERATMCARLSTTKAIKRLDPWLVVRVAEAVMEELAIRKEPVKLQLRSLENVIKRMQELHRVANPHQQFALSEAMRVLRCRADVLTLEEKLNQTRVQLRQTEAKFNRMKDESVSVSQRSTSAEVHTIKTDDDKKTGKFAPEEALERVLLKVPVPVRDEAMALMQERVDITRRSLANEIKSLREKCAEQSSRLSQRNVQGPPQAPIVCRVTDALKEEEFLSDKPYEYRMVELDRLIKNYESLLVRAPRDERPGILAALRILKSQHDLLKLEDEYVVLRAELNGCQVKISSLTEEKAELMQRCEDLMEGSPVDKQKVTAFLQEIKEEPVAADDEELRERLVIARLGHLLGSIPREIRTEILDLAEQKAEGHIQPDRLSEFASIRRILSTQDRRSSERGMKLMKIREQLMHGLKKEAIIEMANSKQWKSGIPSPSRRSSGHRERAFLGPVINAISQKRLLEQQCTRWEDAEEQCAQEMNSMASLLTNIFDFLTLEKWAAHPTSRVLEQSANGLMNAIMLVRNRVTPSDLGPAVIDSEVVALVEQISSGDDPKGVIMLLVQEKSALQSQISGLVAVNRDLQQQCAKSHSAIRDSAGALEITSHAIDALTNQMQKSGIGSAEYDEALATIETEFEQLRTLALSANDGDCPANFEELVRVKLEVANNFVKDLLQHRQMLKQEVEYLKSRPNETPLILEPEGDRPLQFEFETRLSSSGNVEGRVTMQKEGLKEPIHLDFNMLLTGNETMQLVGEPEGSNNVNQEAVCASNSAPFGNKGDAVVKPLPPAARTLSPSRLGRALQRFTKRRKRSPEVQTLPDVNLDSNQNNSGQPSSWERTECAGCRAVITTTTASTKPWMCAACAGGSALDTEWSSVSTLTGTETSWDADTSSDFARWDSPSEIDDRQTIHLTSPPRRDDTTQVNRSVPVYRAPLHSPPVIPRRRRSPITPDFKRHLVSDLVDQVARLTYEDGSLKWELGPTVSSLRPSDDSPPATGLEIPYRPRPTPRHRSHETSTLLRENAEARLLEATASLRRSLARSVHSEDASSHQSYSNFVNLRKPIFFRDIHNNK